ncbi:MAG: 30S ribosomal protein S9 [Streptosporangiales bacterium]|nr:30S ribosomal protein S9 [Streptosporangiales bacterium]
MTSNAEETVEAPEGGVFTSETPADAAPAGDATKPRPVVTGSAIATGRRKNAIARVRLTPGDGTWQINGRPLEVYFPNKVHQQNVREPFNTLEAEGRFNVVARLNGGGVSGQAGALRLAISRALAEIDPENRGPLKKLRFLTRDPRAKERRKYGLKKARKAPQYSKR